MSSRVTTRVFTRSWRLVTLAGLLGTAYYKCCILGAPRTKFLAELGARPSDFGLLASLGAVTLMFQLFSGVYANRLRSRKPIWMTLFIVHRLVFLGVLAAPGIFTTARARITWIIGVMVVHNVLVHAGDPLWLSWMTDLVPRESMTHKWAVRQRFITFFSVLIELAVAFWFHGYEASGRAVEGFIVLGLTGVFLGVIDICLFSLVPEPSHDRDADVRKRAALLQPIRDPAFRPFLFFRAYWMFAIMMSAPFFHPYLITELGLPVFSVQMLAVSHGLGLALASGLWGRICDRHGYRPVLQLIVTCKCLVPLTYVILPTISSVALTMLIVMGFFDGMLNAAGMLATMGVSMRQTPRRNRAMYIASANFVSQGVAGGIAPLLAGFLIAPLTGLIEADIGVFHITGYHAIFLISGVMRLSALPLANRLHEPGSNTYLNVLSDLRRIPSFRRSLAAWLRG